MSLTTLLTPLWVALSVWSGGRWAPLSGLAESLHWRPAAPGVSWSETRLSGPGEAWRIRLIVARLDSHQVRFRLDRAAAWSIDRAPDAALLAINAGHFARLLAEEVVTLALREADRGVDLTHRDVRLALGQDADGNILVALTRFNGAGGALGFGPFVLTVPEMAR